MKKKLTLVKQIPGAPDAKHFKVVERDVVINGTSVHIKSTFSPETTLDKALLNIVARKST